jgi:predicted HTH transcriptional regulator
MALDALENSRDDLTVSGVTFSGLDGEGAASFRAALTARFPKWQSLSQENFFKRALVLDENGGVTRAGSLLLGQNVNPVRFICEREVQDVKNLWSACEELLPRMLKDLPSACAGALRECFINSLLHAEYDAGPVTVELGALAARFSNPGLPRASVHGESEPRNYRLMRIFIMAGLALGEGRGLSAVRGYDPKFRLLWNTLELTTVAELALPGNTVAPVAERVLPAPPTLDWLPVVQERLAMLTDTPSETPKTEEPTEPPVDVGAGIDTFDVDTEAGVDADAVDVDVNAEAVNVGVTVDSEDDEYLGTDEDEQEVFSPLVQSVRSTPRMPLTVVRDAILELCAEYRSLPELASSLARSENSLRRHYVTPMVKEGLLEMELPDKVGHPDQRYKTTSPQVSNVT